VAAAKTLGLARRGGSGPVPAIGGARVLGLSGDSVTTAHLSPAGSIPPWSPAGTWLQQRGVTPLEFNSYGARRGHHEVMMRGTFGNIRLRNGLTEKEVKAEYLKSQQAADKLKDNSLDAFFSVSGWPLGAIAELAATTGIDLVPIDGPEAENLVKAYSFFDLTLKTFSRFFISSIAMLLLFAHKPAFCSVRPGSAKQRRFHHTFFKRKRTSITESTAGYLLLNIGDVALDDIQLPFVP
jgi:hypothetical protein